MPDSNSKPDNNRKGRIKAPRQIGKYELIKRLGAGGMGAVFLATDTKTKRAVALKVLPKDKATNTTLVKRFQSEAQAAANLEHENIVRVYEADQADGYLYISLEYIDGTDVDLILKKRERMPVKRAAEIVKQVAQALQHAHEQNIVHRDIKPSNIMIRSDGVVKLTDLGLARSVDEADDTNITRAGTTVGTVDYMAPEQARNSRLADIRSDLYSLGCTWYQMIVGHPPYHEGSMTNKLQAHASGALPDPRDENPDVPESTVVMIHQLMAKKPEDRYQTPQDLLDDFQNSSMHRSALSDDVLSALAESDTSTDLSRTGGSDSFIEASTTRGAGSDSEVSSAPSDSDSDPTTEQTSRRRKKQNRHGSKRSNSQQSDQVSDSPRQMKLPPRQDKKESTDATERRGTQGDSAPMETLKYLLIAGGFVGVFVGIWYVLSSFASGLDPGGSVGVGESQRETVRELIGENQSAPIPTTGRRQSDGETAPKPTEVTFSETNRTPGRRDAPFSALELIKSPSIYKAPDWAKRVPVSSEITKLLADWQLKPRTVGQWGNQLGGYRTINSALEELPDGPAWIELIGPGPFLMTPVAIEGRSLVISRTSDDYEPTIVCLAGESNQTSEFLKLEGGTLLLTGVNLVVDAQQFPATGPAVLIAMTDGNLSLRDVSISMFGRRAAPTDAISFTSAKSASENSRFLIDRSLIRGHCTSVRLSGHSNSLLVTNSLFLSAQSPVFALNSIDAAAERKSSTSSVNVVRSTLATSHSAFAVNGEEQSSPLHVALEETQCLSSGQAEFPIVDLQQWAVSPTPQPDQSSARNFRWTTNASDFRGWQTLLRSGSNAVEPITEKSTWKKFWDDRFTNSEFSSDTWSAPQPIDAIGFNVNLWTNSSSSGIPANALTLPSTSVQSTTHAMSGLSEATPTVFQQQPPATIELNLDKTNLDEELKKTSWKSGTRFLLSGTRTELLKPIVVDGRSFILEMGPDQPEEFELQPRKNFSESLLTVQNASVQLKNIRMRAPNRSRDNEQPAWLLHVSNGSLSIVDCDLRGPYLENDHYRGLVRWETGQGGRSLPASQPRRHRLEITSSALLTRGIAVSTSPQAGLVRVNKSLIAAQGTAWQCEFQDDTDSLSTLFDFRQSTLGGSDSVLFIADSPQDEAGIRGAFLIHDCLSINTNPSEIRRSKMAFLVADSSWLDQKHLIWWGRANGWSTDIPCFTREPEDVGQLQTINDWVALWGEFNVQKPLYNPGGVLLVEQETDSKELLPEHFLLDPKSRALTWNLDGDPIGANLDNFLPVNTADTKPIENQPSKARPIRGF